MEKTLLNGTQQCCGAAIFQLPVMTLMHFCTPGPTFATNLFLAVLTKRLEIITNEKVKKVVSGVVKRWKHTLLSRAWTKWFTHWQVKHPTSCSISRARLSRQLHSDSNSVSLSNAFTDAHLV